MYNTYNDMSTLSFLEQAFILMRKKVRKIKDLNLKQKKGKLPLPDLKTKLEMTSQILEALREMINMLDFTKPDSEEIAGLYNEIGRRLSLANIEMSDDRYQNVIDILDGFLDI